MPSPLSTALACRCPRCGEGALFELRRDGGTLRFVLAGTDSRGPARGEAVLTPQE